jgi:membrane protein YdbS with pleckstrin-like domain
MSTEFQPAATSRPNGGPDELFERGKKLLEAGHLRESERIFAEVIALGGRRVSEVEYLAGVARLKLGDLDGAAERFQRALEADARNADALYGLGVVAEGRGADERAVALYEQAVSVDKDHAGASLKLRQHRTETGLAERWGVYAYVVGDKSPLARKGLRLMESLRRRARPRLVAYLGRYFGRFLVLGVALAVIAVGGREANSEAGISVPWSAVSAGVGLAILAVFCARVLTTELELDKGRLQVERGILNRRRTSVELWRVRDVELRRPIVNRLTGDCTLVFSLSPAGPARGPGRLLQSQGGRLRVTGLLRGRRLRESYQDLLNLVFVLRSNAQVKGIIQ